MTVIKWAAAMIPAAWTHEPPEPGTWSVAMNVAHLVVYEEEISLPVLTGLADGGDGVGSVRSALEQWFLKDAEAIADQPLAGLVTRLVAVRRRQIDVVNRFSAEDFSRPVTPLFGGPTALKSPGWVATKTFQHTWEHGNAILRMALFAPW